MEYGWQKKQGKERGPRGCHPPARVLTKRVGGESNWQRAKGGKDFDLSEGRSGLGRDV